MKCLRLKVRSGGGGAKRQTKPRTFWSIAGRGDIASAVDLDLRADPGTIEVDLLNHGCR